MVTVVRRITRPNLLRETSVSIQRQRHDSTGVGGKAPVVERGGGGAGASLDIPMPAGTSPLRGHSVLKVERDGTRGDQMASCL